MILQATTGELLPTFRKESSTLFPTEKAVSPNKWNQPCQQHDEINHIFLPLHIILIQKPDWQ